MRKLKKSQLNDKPIDRNRHPVKQDSKTGRNLSTKGELYKARHKYVQTYLEINKKGKYKRARKEPKKRGLSKQPEVKNRQRLKTDVSDDDDTPSTKKKGKFQEESEDFVVPLTKIEKRKLHKKVKKEKIKEKRKEKEDEKYLDFSRFTDKVEFGEVVDAPPKITAKPRGTVPITNKPGQRALLLKSLTHPPSDVPHSNISLAQRSKKAPKVVDMKSTKRKLLTPGQRRIIETEQQRVVDAYRKIRKSKPS